jgi:hypothetical protein
MPEEALSVRVIDLAPLDLPVPVPLELDVRVALELPVPVPLPLPVTVPLDVRVTLELPVPVALGLGVRLTVLFALLTDTSTPPYAFTLLTLNVPIDSLRRTAALIT